MILRLILGDQLNASHSWFAQPDDRVTFVIMEVRQETDYVKHHIQKVAAFFAAMRLGAIRLLLAACKQKEVDERVMLDDIAVLAPRQCDIVKPRLVIGRDRAIRFGQNARPGLWRKFRPAHRLMP